MLTTSIALEFNASLFPGGDALAVRRSAITSAAPLASMASILTFAQIAEILQKSPALAYTGPLEVQYGGSNLTDGLWISAELRATCADGGNTNQPHGSVTGNKECTQAVNSTTGERAQGRLEYRFSLPSAGQPQRVRSAALSETTRAALALIGRSCRALRVAAPSRDTTQPSPLCPS